jgi:hypothetical protein
MTLARPLLMTALLALAPTLAVAKPADDAFEDYRPIYRDLIAQHAEAVVTVKFVMSVVNSGNEQRIEDRTQAVLVSDDGLMIVPDRAVSLDFAKFGNTTPGQAAPVAKSSDFRVRLAGTEDWLPADLVTRDAELGPSRAWPSSPCFAPRTSGAGCRCSARVWCWAKPARRPSACWWTACRAWPSATTANRWVTWTWIWPR